MEKKEILLLDLCARLPYNLVINADGTDMVLDDAHRNLGIMHVRECSEDFKRRSNLSDDDFIIIISGCYYGEDVKPYLRSISSMTEEENNEYMDTFDSNDTTKPTYRTFDWLNSHFFDFRGLIEMGLALEASKDMYN